MIIHGTDDKMIPIEHGAALHEALLEEYRAEPFWAIGKGHNDMDYNFEPYILKVKEYLRDYVEEPPEHTVERKRKKKKKIGLRDTFDL